MEDNANLNYTNKVYLIHEENKSYKLKKHKNHRIKHLKKCSHEEKETTVF